MSKEAALAVATGQPAPESSIDTPKTELKSDPFTHLAKKEEQILRDRKAFKAEREVFEKDREVVLKAKQTYDEYLHKKQTDPIEAMKMLGFSETDIFNYLAQQNPPELSAEERVAKVAEAAAEAKIKAFEEGQVKKEQEAQTKYNTSLIDGYRSDIAKELESNKEKLEYCSYYGPEAKNLAYTIAKEVVRVSDGKDFVTAAEALQMAEEYFEERDKEMAKLRKRQSFMQPTAPKPSPEPVRTRTLAERPNQPESKPTVNKSRTLHNGVTSTVAATRLTRNETKEQKRDRLVEALRNGVKL